MRLGWIVGLMGMLAAPGLAGARDMAPVRVILVGDSTTAPHNGWGDAFCADGGPAVTCLNMAKNGRSSKSYRAEGSWAQVEAELAKKGPWRATYVTVQFGHNDQPNKGDRASDFATEFAPNLARYVADIRAAGARPILITPLSRREFRAGAVTDSLAPWAGAVRQVAVRTKTPLLDLNSDSAVAIQIMGPVKAMDMAQAPPPADTVAAVKNGTTPPTPKPQPGAKTVFDYTHLGPAGAAFFSHMIEDELAVAAPGLAAHFKKH
jgi:lysophospholipase L1-like esterase